MEGDDSEVNEGANESNDEEQHALQGFDVDSETERDLDNSTASIVHTVLLRRRKFGNIFGHIFPAGAGARTAYLDVE